MQDVSYRVTRYFGKTAAKDTFSLLDLTNRCPSTRFSEKLGEELFQLDADSFARSTYVPQLSASDMQATTSIRTKLSNLVDDTNDLRNYDTAEKKLRDYRTKFRAYRGEGGAINEIIRERLKLESDKYKAEQLRPGLQEVVESIDRLNGEKAIKTDAVNNLREKIRLASDQKVRIANQKQLNSLRLEVEKKQQYLQEMDEDYPVGYPTAEEIKEQRENLSIIQQEGQRLQALKLSDADKEITEGEQHWFANTEQVAADIEQCDRDCKELGGVSAKMTAQMLPEELERLNALSKQFTAGIPTEAELQICMTAADDLSDAQRQYAELSVSAESQKCLAQFQELFRSGIPDDSALSDCEQALHDRDVLIQSRSAHVFPDNEQKQYDALKRTFAAGVPAEEEIQSKQTDSRRIAELTAKKNTQTTIIQQELPQEPSEPSKVPLVCGGAGAALLVFGIICFVMQLSIPGIIFLVAGFVALLTAFWLHTKSIVNNQTRSSASVITASAISDEENQELYTLQHALNDFLLRFYDDAADPDNKLVQLRIDSKAYADLHEKKLPVLHRYYPIELPKDLRQGIRTLSGEVTAYNDLKAKKKAMIDGIEAELRDLRQERDRIRRSVENIPAWEDRMARLQNEQEEDERKCALADQTLALLSQAKDNLANSYVGRVERGFENYANTLMGNQLGDVMVDKDLHLHIDEKGAAREVGSFSAGTIDCIMLCMRLSLVDALFGDEKPFLILDDPFVNLDDEHTKRALEMLDKIAEDHQVVYLVCNTSRK